MLMGTGIVSNQSLMFAGWLLNMVQRCAMHTVCVDTMQRLHGASVFSTDGPDGRGIQGGGWSRAADHAPRPKVGWGENVPGGLHRIVRADSKIT